MTITFHVVSDFSNLLWYILTVSVLFTAGCLYLGYRMVRISEILVKLYGQRKEQPVSIVWPSGPVASTPVQVSQATQEVRRPTTNSTDVPEVSPEIILKRTPKPTGFGSTSHGVKQPEPGGDTPSGDGEKGSPPPTTCSPGKL